MAAITRVRHVAVGCADMEETLRLYRGVLGLAVVADERDEAGRRSVTLPVGLSALVLIEKATEAGADAGIVHVAFDTDDAGTPRAGVDLEASEHMGLPLRLYPATKPPPQPPGPVECLDHLVVGSGDSGRAAEHFASALGLEIKRKMIRPGTSAQLAFGKLYDVVIEFAGPPEPRPGALEAKFFGIVFTVKAMTEVVADLRAAGFEVSEPKAAVQPGAVIATVKGGTGGVPFALIQYNAIPI